MAEEIRTDGQRTIIKKDGSQQIIESGKYTANTAQRNTTHSSTAIVQSGTSRNVEISGNSQEVYAGRGVTSEYSFKVIGTPQLFTGKAQRAADKAFSKLVGLLLQQGDDSREASPGKLVEIDLQKAVSHMSSSWGASLAPCPPQITKIKDIPKLTAYMTAYCSTVSAEGAAYKALCAGKVELERQWEQQKATLRRLRKSLGQGDITAAMAAGTPATDDRQGKPNITRKVLYEQVIPSLPQGIAAEGELG